MLKLFNKVNMAIDSNVWLKSIIELIVIVFAFAMLHVCVVIYGIAIGVYH